MCPDPPCKSIRIYMGVIILGANTSNIKFCLFKEILMASKGVLYIRYSSGNQLSTNKFLLHVASAVIA